MNWRVDGRGVTLVELMISLTVFMIVILSAFSMFTALVNSAVVAKRQAVALTLATNQMEYLKSLPYDDLAVAGGSIYSPDPLPATSNKTINGVRYTITTSINYIDDAFDGCGSYPTQELKEQYCRNYPPPSGSPATDSNPRDYKIAHVRVTDAGGTNLAEVDTQISARVSETASTTGAMFVNVLDDKGNPVSGASVNLQNSTITPALNLSDNTDSNGVAIFYGLTVDTSGFDYTITANKSGYSTLTTIKPSGSLQPTYSSQNILTQQSSYVSLTIKQQGSASLVAEATTTTGTPLANARLAMKGGYKKYSDSADTQYYYDNFSPTDTRPTADGSGFVAYTNLVPGDYFFCGDTGATGCTVGGTTYYLAAAVPYGGTSTLQPVIVPTYDPSSPPTTTFDFNGTNYLQKVRLMLTTSAGFPRVSSLSPSEVSLSSGSPDSFSFTLNGQNLPCDDSPGSCGTSVSLKQGASTFPASCTGDNGQLNCTVNLASATTGQTQLEVTVGGNTLTLPGAPLLGGIVVSP